jgi:hypothetical protein
VTDDLFVVQGQIRAKKNLQFFFITALWIIESAVFEIVLEFNSSVLIFFLKVFGCRCMWNQFMKKYEIALTF